MWKKWTKIENCPQQGEFLAVFKLGWRFKIEKVYVHTDNYFPFWRVLMCNGVSIGKWKCIYYKTN